MNFENQTASRGSSRHWGRKSLNRVDEGDCRSRVGHRVPSMGIGSTNGGSAVARSQA